MELSRAARVFFLLGLALIGVALAAAVLERVALQTPYSPLHLPLPDAPATQLRSTCLHLAGLSFLLAVFTPHLAPDRQPWLLVGLFGLGTAVEVGVQAYAAIHGMMAIQLVDPRPGASTLAYARLGGEAVLTLAYADVLRRATALRRRRREPPPPAAPSP